MEDRIKENNAKNKVSSEEVRELISKANSVFKENHSNKVWFERSIFINWSCGIADCKYCYLSTMPKNKEAIRSKESIIAEMLLCKAMGWKIGYLTGGLRVEKTSYLVDLLKECQKVEKVRMNFGPYNLREIEAFEPHINGMGSAIESFDEELHNFICPSKPLSALKRTLQILKDKNMFKFITIILGMGEKKEDIEEVIRNIEEYDINMVQLCFLKPQKGTIFSEVPPPNMEYMAWWVAKLRIAFPKLIIKIALVDDRIEEFSLLLEAGANCFSRFMIFKHFNSELAFKLKKECEKSGRELEGEFFNIPKIEIPEGIVGEKLKQYIKKLEKNKLISLNL